MKKETKEKIINWFKNPYNLTFILIILLTFSIRLYYFSMTNTQPLWWDEAEYGLKAKSFAFGTPTTGWAPEREIIVPLFFALLLKIGFGEVFIRFVQLLVSVATVAGIYLVAKEIIDDKSALFASFMMSVFWLQIFFTQRILLYLWAPLVYLVIIYTFWKGYIKGNKKWLYAFAISASLGLQIYFSIGFLLFGIFLYLLSTEKLSFLKKKEIWIVAGIFLLTLLPIAVYYQITYGFPLPRFAVGYTAATTESGAGLSGIFGYLSMFPSRIGWTGTIIGFLGIILFLVEYFLVFDLKEERKKKNNLLLILYAFLIPLALYTLYAVIGGSATFYDAFILSIFPFFFMFSGIMITRILSFKKEYKNLLWIVVLILLGIILYFGLVQSSATISAKLTSYDGLKQAGEWIKKNSNTTDIIFCAGVPQLTYYSERKTYNYPSNESEFLKQISELNPRYMILTHWENSPEWSYNWPQENNQTIVAVQAFQNSEFSATTVIYEFLTSETNNPL